MRFGKIILLLGLILFFLAIPVGSIIGTMAVAGPGAPKSAFWDGFLFIEAIPMLMMLIGIVIMVIISWRRKIEEDDGYY
ncbi:hypothetical protein HPK19_04320 [Arthrobacter citreus]|nr:hypothetical protein HPK19_04320 [Arthrobacter citreus]